LVRPGIERGRFDIEPGREIFHRQEHAVIAGGVLRHPRTPLERCARVTAGVLLST
jgi:hypothetical protein